jgi:hypothetical protein
MRLFCNQSPQLPDKQLDIQGSGLGRLCPQDSIDHLAVGSSPGGESEVRALHGVVSLTSSAARPFQDHLGQSEDDEQTVHGACCPSGGVRDVGSSGQMKCSDGEVAEGCHDLGAGSGSDVGLVFLGEGVVDPGQGLA